MEAKRYEEACKRQAVEHWLRSGRSGTQNAQELGMSDPSLKEWPRRGGGEAALAFFHKHGVTAQRLYSDKGSCSCALAMRAAVAALSLKHRFLNLLAPISRLRLPLNNVLSLHS